MAETKYCPLSYATEKGAYDQEVSNFDFCKEKDCAWWHKDYVEGHQIRREGCAILMLTESLAYITKLGTDGSDGLTKREIEAAKDRTG